MPGAPQPWSQPPWRSCSVCLLPAAGLHTLNRSQPPAGRRPPGHCPSTCAGHPLPHCRMKAIPSAAPPSIPLSSSCCRATCSLALCVSGPPPQPLSPQQIGGPAASLGQLLLPFIHTTPLLPVEWSSRQHCPPLSSVSADPIPSVG